MKITITGSLGNIGRFLTEKLLQSGHHVTVVSHSEDRKPEIERLGADAAIGSISDVVFLRNAFKDADAVFAMTPPNMGGIDIISNTVEAGKAMAKAIKESAVSRVVMLSSIGADLPDGNGPIAALHHIEKAYAELEGVAVTFLRAGYFFTNFYNDILLIKTAGITGSNYPSSTSIPLVHPFDIAMAAAERLEQPFTGKNIQYVISDFRTARDVADVLGNEIGQPELPWIEFTDEEAFQGMMQAGVPGEIAGLYVEMGAGIRAGKIQTDFKNVGAPVTGQVKLEDFAKEFADRF
ncbi:NAD(P)H-binding protein [Sphingobacterium spiritivorum]|uniref:TrkA N-terminal domain protein n=1 Tax=Sphingobacterium spiritivorum ATCC 33861 TaxID=525373 RepID=D7VJ06_SPHSI|nr:NAD(P)H-binding protein [Sphingobacterium spiritivorum]EFK59141.1 TrkA N-terminal domain protein [Sphingobacterium spiritivorum ATCC 33861]QQT34217.1 NAD(P)H-binding protein [Sphingobacterium spiritivorum]WQD35055.1 NAD(P)H-binding protein [Sphingobacterium spiritivorum]SUI99284.1 Putative NADH-flavin reductase [Sphingobacterium spiritivorum]